MEGDSVYHIEQTLEQTKIRLNQDESLNPVVKKAILDFIDDLTLANQQIPYIFHHRSCDRISSRSCKFHSWYCPRNCRFSWSWMNKLLFDLFRVGPSVRYALFLLDCRNPDRLL